MGKTPEAAPRKRRTPLSEDLTDNVGDELKQQKSDGTFLFWLQRFQLDSFSVVWCFISYSLKYFASGTFLTVTNSNTNSVQIHSDCLICTTVSGCTV